jgi:hypothetical protein
MLARAAPCACWEWRNLMMLMCSAGPLMGGGGSMLTALRAESVLRVIAEWPAVI